MDFKSLLIGALGSALLFVSVGAGIDNHEDYGEVGLWMPVATSEKVYIVNTKTGETYRGHTGYWDKKIPANSFRD